MKNALRVSLPVLFSVLAFGASAPLAFADSVNVNFDGYTLGTVNGQDGWSATGPYDQAIVNTSDFGSPTGFGSKALRVSDRQTSGSFGDWVFVKSLTDSVGETGATNGTFSAGTKQNHFEMQFDIAAASTTPQSGLEVSVAPDRGDGSRMSYLRFQDSATGINVFFDDVPGILNSAVWNEVQVGTNLDRTVPHTIKLTFDALDGASNDIVKVYIDGNLVHTGMSWENYYRNDTEAAAEPTPRIIKTMIIQARGTANPIDVGYGFLFDNISLSSSEVATVVSSGNIADLQSAVDTTPSGGTVQVSGSYTGNLTINHAISLVATIGATPSLVGQITIASDNVTIDGMNITNPAIGYGIVATDHSHLHITNNTVHDIGTTLTSGSAQAIDIVSSTSDVTDITISRNHISNIGSTGLLHGGSAGSSAKGVYLGNSGGAKNFDGVTISNNVISGVYAGTVAYNNVSPHAGGGAGAYGIMTNHANHPESSSYGATKNLTISDNTISTLEGWWAHAIGLEGNTPNASVTGNTISGLVDHSSPSDSVGVRLEDNADASTVTINNTNTRDGLVMTNSTASVIVDPSLAPYMSYTGAEVLANGAYRYIGMNATSTIQGGVSLVATGGTVNVAVGNYAESVLVNRSLTLSGASGAVIAGTSTTPYILKIDGVSGGATVSGLEINGGSSNVYQYGVLVNNSGSNSTPVELKNLTVKNVWWTGGANGIEVDAASVGGSYVNIHDSTVSSFQKRGIRFINSSGQVHASEVIGDNVDGTSRVQNLVNLWGGSNVEIYGNKLHNALTTGLTPTWDSPGILVTAYGGSGASTANIHDNEIYSDDTGVTVGSVYVSGSDNSSATIVNNNFHNLATGVSFEKNTITATINKNVFNTTPVGVTADQATGSTTQATINATQNWWGNASGPKNATTNPTGTGATIYSNTSFSPWYTDASMTTLTTGTPNFSGNEASTTVPVAVTQTGSSDGVTVTADIPQGTVVTASSTWDGTIKAPTASVMTVAGYDSAETTAIAVGSDTVHLVFDNAVKLTFAGQHGKKAGWYNQAGTFEPIAACSSINAGTFDQTWANTYVPADGECAFDSGSDLAVWTKHFSTFVTYSTPAAPVISPSSAVFHGSVNVTMDDSAPGAGIRYTVDGTDPVCGGNLGYANGQILTFTGATILKAIRCDGASQSSISSANFSSSGGGGDGSSGGSSGGGGGSIAATPATPAVPGVSPATPATPATPAKGKVLGAEAYNFTKALAVGVRGDEVTELQKVLIAGGFLKVDAPTGYFGQLTRTAVIAFQKARGIAQVGNVGPLTRAELNKGIISTTPETTTPAAEGKTNLTASQANAIISLIESFGADASVVAKVKAALGQ